MKFIWLAFIMAGTTLYAEPVELLGNGSFEKFEKGKILGWAIQGGNGKLEIIQDAHSGKNAASITTIGKKSSILYTSFPAASISKIKNTIPAGKNAKYHVSCWAKGKGVFYFWVPFLNRVKQVGSKRSKDIRLTPEYKKYEFVFTTDAPEVKNLRINIFCMGYTETQMIIDDVSLTFDPDENQGVDPCLN